MFAGARTTFRQRHRPIPKFAISLCAGLVALSSTVVSVDAFATNTAPTDAPSSLCSWASPQIAAQFTPAELAAQVLARMTLAEKVGEIELVGTDKYENENAGVPSLCIPRLTLQDGPNGLSPNDPGVTQLPASIGIAASFNPALAYTYGTVLGSQARQQGIDVVQAPNLNLARLPNTGRIYEGYGEDPDLVSAMGVADIEGIQSEGVMADAKHLGAYTQETLRSTIDQQVSQRALEEVYLAPFRAAVQQADVASSMCSFGRLNQVYTCQDPALFDDLGAWGFSGFVRSDLDAVKDPVAAFDAGLDLLKPADSAALISAVRDGTLPIGRVNSVVLSILTEMFAYRLVQNPLVGKAHTPVATVGDRDTALSSAEQSMVLLKNNENTLPLDATQLGSVAVIGVDATTDAMTAGFGSARVDAPFVSTPLSSIRQWLKNVASVTYSPGGPENLTPVQGSHVPTARLIDSNFPGTVTPAIATATKPGHGLGWQTWSHVIVPKQSGLSDFSLQSEGDTWLYLNETSLIAEPGLHGPAPWSTTVSLRAGHRYVIRVRWFATTTASVQRTATPQLRWTNVSPMIGAAIRAAKRSRYTIVFVSDYTEEGFDRPTLSLPGDANALISSVASVNPNTVVVLNTGGAVLMPWLSKVAAVLEAWYPGEEDGNATVAILSGANDPSGHLPVTFPRSDAASPMAVPSLWPGVNGVVSMGLDVGYRYYETRALRTLFPFGYGLSYTTFVLSDLNVIAVPGGYAVQVVATNTGSVAGKAVVQGYLTYPPAAHEPGEVLKAFTTTNLDPLQSTTLTLSLPESAFAIYRNGSFRSIGGGYLISVGQNEQDLPLSAAINLP